MNELNAESLFVTEKDKEVSNKVANNKGSVPGNYIKIKLSSLGKLTTPGIIHARNYNFEEALELSEITLENEKEILIRILENLIYEDIDVGLLHEQEAMEILLNIYARWWGNKLEGFRYFIDDTLPRNEIEKKENISIAEIPIKNIKTKELPNEVKEPINITDSDGNKVSLLLPRIRNSVIAKKFVDEKYIEEENKFFEIKKAIEAKQKYDIEEFRAYTDYLNVRSKDYFMVYQALLIHSINDKGVESLTDALDKLSEIELPIWKEYRNIVEEHFNFGIESMVKFKCTVTEKEITRRFLFRPMALLPPMESKHDSGYTFSFG